MSSWKFRSLGRRAWWVLRRIRAYVRNRWIDQVHLLHITAMAKGSWYDCDYQLFHAMFQVLRNYVEQELWGAAFRAELEPAWSAYLTTTWWDRWRRRGWWRQQFGLAWLAWESSLDNPALEETERSPQQAAAARTLTRLYQWYVFERPHRPEPFEDPPEAPGQALTPEWYRQQNALEQAQLVEDHAAMKELVDVSGAMWT